ncbi:butyrate kinase [Aerococcus urinae]|uniref:Probable butyrate kinase n=1 Tax=Aerococcus mictus TaxID=2976810 RepID=A0ABZ2EEM1_9LACT|nr:MULTISPECIES: butyrate kinase [Aerococcus]KAA9293597.1 butyrate kinase [Aerococcus mictus]MBU5609855.1 butyrate kinase [Aerococcus urinae]MCY3033862.1 butyrate kinase [Aerococcus mictus]MCY3063151.1 butyrate kinase [Aerococcus mictus]MCY3065166.1 butyrate kinase [Aerococcus mictus]
MKILAINPGSTSTKVSVYSDGKIQAVENYQHSPKDLAHLGPVIKQKDLRKQCVVKFIEEQDLTLDDLDAISARGGTLPAVNAGAYRINEQMVDYLTHKTRNPHASSLAAIIAYELKIEYDQTDLPIMIYDSVAVDQFDPVARLSGLKGAERVSGSHALNTRAVAMKVCQELGTSYQAANLIVCHMGGGISTSVHQQGRMIDNISDDEGPMGMDRTGELPLLALFKVIEGCSYEEMVRLNKQEGGIKSYTGLTDMRQVQAEADQGNDYYQLVIDAFVYQIAKAIGSLATVLKGKVDRIILTGGVAHSQRITQAISDRVAFIAPVIVEAGEHEMLALSQGAERVVLGKEDMQEFILNEI